MEAFGTDDDDFGFFSNVEWCNFYAGAVGDKRVTDNNGRRTENQQTLPGNVTRRDSSAVWMIDCSRDAMYTLSGCTSIDFRERLVARNESVIALADCSFCVAAAPCNLPFLCCDSLLFCSQLVLLSRYILVLVWNVPVALLPFLIEAFVVLVVFHW